MTADEMLKKLGYEKKEIYDDGFHIDDVYRLRTYGDAYKDIVFNYDEESIRCYGKEERMCVSSINMEELKAINKKCEELRMVYGGRRIVDIKAIIQEEMRKYEWAISSYDCDEANYSQSQAVGAYMALLKLKDKLEVEE